ncbi:MAG: 50S ribosomal protein L30 [Bdellovibrionales bacterium]
MATAKKKITVVQTGSIYGKGERARATLLGLGLGVPNRERELEDTPAVRGMIKKVGHLVKIKEGK